MPQHKICSAKVTRFGEPAVVIVAAFSNPGGYPIAESFVLIPDGKGTMFANRCRFDVKSFHDSSIELDEDFMLEQALAQATIDLGIYLDKDGKSYSDLPETPSLINPSDMKLLVRLWVRGRCEQLAEVYQKTECDQLRDVVRPILDLPKISIREL
jgi:hypothetical protein